MAWLQSGRFYFSVFSVNRGRITHPCLPLATSVSPEFASLMFAVAFTTLFALIMKVMAQRGWRIVI